MSWGDTFLSDVTVAVEGKEYPLHKCKLAIGPTSSEYFRSLFQFNPALTRTQLDIAAGSEEVWESVLGFIYDGELKGLSLTTVVKFSFLADYLRIPALAEKINNFFATSKISAPEAFVILVDAIDPRRPQIITRMASIVAKELTKFSTEQLNSLPSAVFTELVTLSPTNFVYSPVVAFFNEVHQGKLQLTPTEFDELVKCLQKAAGLSMNEDSVILLHLALRFNHHVEFSTSQLVEFLRKPISINYSYLAPLPWDILSGAIKTSGILQSPTAFSFIVGLTEAIKEHSDFDSQQKELWGALDYTKLKTEELKKAYEIPYACQLTVFKEVSKRLDQHTASLQAANTNL